MPESPSLRFGVDIGGTFTDLVIVDVPRQRMYVGKCLTTPSDPSEGVLVGLRQMVERHAIDPRAIANVSHATTLMTNALIERKGARTALITTRGFRDVIQIGRESRYEMYDIFLRLPEPLVPRPLRLEVDERLDSGGRVLVPLDRPQLQALAKELAALGVESVAVSFLHSYLNPAHEEEAARILEEAWPGGSIYISISSRVAREIREYERTSTTVANAYVRPLADRYLDRMESGLAGAGCHSDLYLMLSSGGVCTVETAREFPIRLVESGPAAGALVGSFYGKLAGQPDVIAFDMGGTTAKACLIENGRPATTFEFEVARVHRFKKGSGLPVKVPTIELIEIGAGGGSIAHIDAMGLLKVGPESAGAEPGPACYGRGGHEPTVTDADLVLGYLDPGYFLGGEMALDRDAAEAALTERVSRPLGLSVLQAAWGVHEIVNENMASAARIHIAERGQDPRRYAIVATGGAGPVHVFRLARKLHIGKVICPMAAGVASTTGLLVTPPRLELVQSYFAPFSGLDWAHINDIYASLEAEAADGLARAGVARNDITFNRYVDARYVGQGHEVVVPVPEGVLGPEQLPAMVDAFTAIYQERFGRAIGKVEIEGLTWRLVAVGPSPDLGFLRSGDSELVAAGFAPARTLVEQTGVAKDAESQQAPCPHPSPPRGSGAGGEGALAPLKGTRPVYFGEADYRDTPVYDRYRLRPGDRYQGPAVVEERESTVVVGPNASFWVDEQLSLIMELEDHEDGR